MWGQGRRARRPVLCALLAGSGLLLVPIAAQATVSVNDAQVTETNGDVAATFTITRAASALAPAIAVGFQTADGSAGAADYVATSGTRPFAATLFATTQTQTVSVTVKGDALDEATEGFRLVLSGPEITDGEGIGTILDDDPSPAVGVSDAPDRTEGAASATSPFTIRLSAVSGRDIAVPFTTADGTATAGDDYVARSGTVTIPAGASTAAVDVQITDDSAGEPAETFELRLGNPSGASVGDGAATARIIDDDAQSASAGTLAGGTRLGLFGLGLKRNRFVSVRVNCPAPAGRCRGRVTLFTRPIPTSKIDALRTERRLGRRQFNVAGAHGRTLRMTLHRVDRGLLLREGRLRVRAFAVAEDASGHAGSRTLIGTIKARRGKR